VSKMQIVAMRRGKMPEEERKYFYFDLVNNDNRKQNVFSF
jgi:hypothetical protein